MKGRVLWDGFMLEGKRLAFIYEGHVFIVIGKAKPHRLEKPTMF